MCIFSIKRKYFINFFPLLLFGIFRMIVTLDQSEYYFLLIDIVEILCCFFFYYLNEMCVCQNGLLVNESFYFSVVCARVVYYSRTFCSLKKNLIFTMLIFDLGLLFDSYTLMQIIRNATKIKTDDCSYSSIYETNKQQSVYLKK